MDWTRLMYWTCTCISDHYELRWKRSGRRSRERPKQR